MNAIEIAALVALTGYSVYRQTRRSELVAESRFKLAIVYAIVGICLGGMHAPIGVAGYGLLAAGLVLSALVGVVRGQLTRVWREEDGRMYSQGTALTVGLFLGMIVVKFALGFLAYVAHINDGAGIGEVLVMIAIMIAVQAQIVHHRSSQLAAAPVSASIAA